MNLLVFCLLVALCSSCVSSVFCALTFNYLCEEDTFEYKGQTVNSFYRIGHSNDLMKIGDYAVDEFLDFNDYFQSNKAVRLEKNKKMYNSRLIALYSEALLNSPKFTHNDYTTANGLLDVLRAMKTFQVVSEMSLGQLKLNESIARIEKGWLLAKELMMYKRNFLNPAILTVRQFEELVSLVKPDSADTMIFQNELISDVYRKGIFQFDRFELNRHSKLFFDWKSTGTMYYSIYLPVNESNYRNKPDCYKASDAPAFFRDPNAR